MGRELDGPANVYVGLQGSEYSARFNKSEPESFRATGSATSTAAGRVSYFFGLSGEAMSIDTACSSSLVSLNLGVRAIERGDAADAICVGVHANIEPTVFGLLSVSGMLSPEGRCKTFDRQANGYVRAEGCGALFVSREDLCVGSALAAIVGHAVNQDGRSNGLTAPNGPSQVRLLREATQNLGSPVEMSMLEAHGTGTSLGDPIEMQAVAEAIGSGRGRGSDLLVGSAKTNFGHAETAAGMLGIVKVLMALHHKEVPRHLHLRELNPYIGSELLEGIRCVIPLETVSWLGEAQVVGVSAFGFSGTNAHIVFAGSKAYDLTDAYDARDDGVLLLVSAAVTSSLDRLLISYSNYFANVDVSVRDMAHIQSTLSYEHRVFSKRAIISGSSTAEILRSLKRNSDVSLIPGIATGSVGSGQKVGFFFTGAEADALRSLNGLRKTGPDVAALAEEFSQSLGVQDVFTTHGHDLGALSLAMGAFQVLKDWNITASGAVGYGLTEPIAAHIAQAVSLAEAGTMAKNMWLARRPNGNLRFMRLFTSEETARQMISKFRGTEENARFSVKGAVSAPPSPGGESLFLQGTYTEESRPVGLFDLIGEPDVADSAPDEVDTDPKSSRRSSRKLSPEDSSNGSPGKRTPLFRRVMGRSAKSLDESSYSGPTDEARKGPSAEKAAEIMADGLDRSEFSQHEAVRWLSTFFKLTDEEGDKLFENMVTSKLIALVQGKVSLLYEFVVVKEPEIALAGLQSPKLYKGTRAPVIAFVSGTDHVVLRGSPETLNLFKMIALMDHVRFEFVAETFPGMQPHTVDSEMLETEMRKISFQRTLIPAVVPTSGKVIQFFNAKHWGNEMKQWPTALVVKRLRDTGIQTMLCIGHDHVVLPSVSRQVSAERMNLLRCWSPSHNHVSLTHVAGSLWTRGVEVDFERLIPRLDEPVFGLPTYSFNRQVFWTPLEARGGSGDALSGDSIIHRNVWFDSPMKSSVVGVVGGTWIVIGAGELIEEMQTLLVGQGQTVVSVKASYFFAAHEHKTEYFIRATEREDYLKLFESLSARRNLPEIRGIISFVSFIAKGKDSIDFCGKGTLGLLQALMEVEWARSEPPKLWLVTDHAISVPGDGVAVDVGQSVVAGLGMSAAEELSNSVTVLDVHNISMEAILQEVAAGSLEVLVVMRPFGRFVRKIRAMPLVVNPLYLTDSSAVVVIGGLGSKGLAFGSELLRLGCKNLILVDLPERRSKVSLRKLKSTATSLEAKVVLMFADMTDVDDVAGLKAELLKLRSGVRGIIYAARLKNYAPLSQGDWDPDMREGMAPLVQGVANVENIFGLGFLKNLDFFACCCSVGAIIPSTGVAGSAAASKVVIERMYQLADKGVSAVAIAIGPIRPDRPKGEYINFVNKEGYNLMPQIEVARAVCRGLTRDVIVGSPALTVADFNFEALARNSEAKIGMFLDITQSRKQETVDKNSRKNTLLPAKMVPEAAAVSLPGAQHGGDAVRGGMMARMGHVNSVVFGIISQLTAIPEHELREDSSLNELGLDSMTISSLRDGLSEFTRVPVRAQDLMSQETLSDLSYFVADNVRPEALRGLGQSKAPTSFQKAEVGEFGASSVMSRRATHVSEPDLVEDESKLPFLAQHFWARLFVQTILVFIMFAFVCASFYPTFLFYGYAIGISPALYPILVTVFNLTFMLLVVLAKWLVIGRYRSGRYGMWSAEFLNWWFMDRLLKWMQLWVGTENFKGTIVGTVFYKLMGAQITWDCLVDEPMFEFDLVQMDHYSGSEASLSAARIENGELILGPIHLMEGSWVGMQAVVEPFTTIPAFSKLDDMSCIRRGLTLKNESAVGVLFSGSPAEPTKSAYVPVMGGRGAGFIIWSLFQWCIFSYIRSGALIIPLAPAFLLFDVITKNLSRGLAIGSIPLLMILVMIGFMFCTIVVKWVCLGRVTEGRYNRWGWFAFRRQLVRHVYSFLDSFIFMHNTTKWLQLFLRLMGVTIGSDTLVGQPSKLLDFDLIEFKQGAFAAAQTMFKTWRIEGGELVLEPVTIGKGAWMGTACLIQPGAYLPDGSAAAGLSMITKGTLPSSALKGVPCLPMGSISAIPEYIGYFPWHEVCVQVIFAIVLYIMFGLPIIAAYLAMDGIYSAILFRSTNLQVSFLFQFTFLIGLTVLVFGTTFLAIMVRRLQRPIGPNRPVKWTHRHYWLSNTMEGLVLLLLGGVGGGSELMNIAMQLLGAEVGEGAYLEPSLIADPPMLEFGRRATIRLAMVEAHAPPHGRWIMEFGPVRVGAYSSVERNTLLIYPLDVSPHVVMRPITRGLVGERYASGTTWVGSVASEVLQQSGSRRRSNSGLRGSLLIHDELGKELYGSRDDEVVPQLRLRKKAILSKKSSGGLGRFGSRSDESASSGTVTDLGAKRKSSLDPNSFEAMSAKDLARSFQERDEERRISPSKAHVEDLFSFYRAE